MRIAFFTKCPSTASPRTSSLLLVGRARNLIPLISCRCQQKDPTVRTAQPRSLRQVMPGPYSTEHSAYEFNCRAKIASMFCTTFYTTRLFFVLLEHCVCPCTFVERPWHPLIGPAQIFKNTRPSIRAGFGIQFCPQLGQICE
jgi:hypothetical protein